MRVLFTLTPGTGSLHPLLPIAHALGSAGHSVALCSAASFRPDVEAAGFDFFPGGLDYDFARPDFNDILLATTCLTGGSCTRLRGRPPGVWRRT